MTRFLKRHADKFHVEDHVSEPLKSTVWARSRYGPSQAAAAAAAAAVRSAPAHTNGGVTSTGAGGHVVPAPEPKRFTFNVNAVAFTPPQELTASGRRGTDGSIKAAAALESAGGAAGAGAGAGAGAPPQHVTQAHVLGLVKEVLEASPDMTALVANIGHRVDWSKYRAQFGGLKGFLERYPLLFHVTVANGSHMATLRLRAQPGAAPATATVTAVPTQPGTASPTAPESTTTTVAPPLPPSPPPPPSSHLSSVQRGAARAAQQNDNVFPTVVAVLRRAGGKGVHLATLGNMTHWADHRQKYGNLRAYLLKYCDVFALERNSG